MSLFALSCLSCGISFIILSAVTLFFSKTALHRRLLFFNISVIVWGLGLFAVGIADTESEALLRWKIANAGGMFVGPFFYHFVISFCGIRRKRLLLSGYLLAMLFAIAILTTDYIINKTRFTYSIYFIEANHLYTLALIFYMSFVLFSYIELFKFLPNARGHKRSQSLYIIYGFMFGFVGATTSFLPMFKIDIIYPFGNFGITMSGIFLTYAIFRNHLMDINIALKRSLIYSLTVSIVTGLYVVFVIMVTKLLSDVSGISSLAITTLAALIMALLFHPLRDRVQSLIDRLFSKTTYDYYSTVNKVSYELASTIDLKYIQRYIVDTMFSLLKVKTAYLLSEKDGYFVPAYYRCHKNTPDNDMSKKRISKGSELINFMNSKKILIKEELQMLHDYPAAVIEDLILFESEVAVPVFIEDKIAFLFILGEKLSGDMLSEEDIRLLTTIANQASTALKNALLYEELEVRVEKRTAEITAVVDQLQEEIIEKMHAEVELKRFSKKLEQKNQELQEFAYIASHDLQEPLRKVMAFGDRLKTKYGTVLDDQGRDYLDRMLNATGRMQNFINDLLAFSRITTRAHPFILTDLAKVAHEVLTDLEVRINETGGHVHVEQLPVLDADPVQMRQLFQNLIGNSLKFHNENIPPIIKITSTLNYNNGDEPHSEGSVAGNAYYEIAFEDNGIGFDKKYKDRIFSMFQRLHGKNEYEGTGIGLSVCRKIVERHGGTIKAKSSPGQGAEFIVTLPAKHSNGDTAQDLNIQ